MGTTRLVGRRRAQVVREVAPARPTEVVSELGAAIRSVGAAARRSGARRTPVSLEATTKRSMLQCRTAASYCKLPQLALHKGTRAMPLQPGELIPFGSGGGGVVRQAGMSRPLTTRLPPDAAAETLL